MTQYLRSLICAKKYLITCPGRNAKNKTCGAIWLYKVCRQIGLLTKEEKEEFELAFASLVAELELGAK